MEEEKVEKTASASASTDVAAEAAAAGAAAVCGVLRRLKRGRARRTGGGRQPRGSAMGAAALRGSANPPLMRSRLLGALTGPRWWSCGGGHGRDTQKGGESRARSATFEQTCEVRLNGNPKSPRADTSTID